MLVFEKVEEAVDIVYHVLVAQESLFLKFKETCRRLIRASFSFCFGEFFSNLLSWGFP